MAAYDSFEQFNSTLTRKVREDLREFTDARRAELLAARSEDARTRLLHAYVEEVHELLREGKR